MPRLRYHSTWGEKKPGRHRNTTQDHRPMFSRRQSIPPDWLSLKNLPTIILKMIRQESPKDTGNCSLASCRVVTKWLQVKETLDWILLMFAVCRQHDVTQEICSLATCASLNGFFTHCLVEILEAGSPNRIIELPHFTYGLPCDMVASNLSRVILQHLFQANYPSQR